MNAMTLQNAQAALPQVARRVVDDIEPMLIQLEDGRAVVLLALEEFNAWRETAYLLSNPANAAHLAKSIAEDKAGQRMPQPLSVFADEY